MSERLTDVVQGTARRISRRGLTILGIALLLTACQPKASAGHSQIVDGVRFEYGLASSAQVAEHPPRHVEGAMHGGATRPTNVYHVTLALFDAANGSRIDDATVFLRVAGPGHRHRFTIPLEPMPVASAMTYGGYVVLPKPATYRFTFQARRPSRQSTRASFQVERPS